MSNPYAAALPPAAPPEAVIRVANRALEAGATREAVQLPEPLLESAEGGALVAAATPPRPTRATRRKKRAEAVLLGFVERVPRYVRAHLMLGEMYRAAGLATRAKAAYQRALALDPENSDALDALAAPEPPPPATRRRRASAALARR
ncbi:MAG: hypothetical protein U0599_09175 [Vicinamibacteria bacterium]